MMKKWMKPAGALALILIVVSAFIVRGHGAVDDDGAELEFQVAERRALEVTAEAAGQIEPIRLVEVKSKASGDILSLVVESGDFVRRGDLIGQVDPRDVRNAYAQAEADLAVAVARLTTAEAQKRRSRELREANVITEQEFEAATFEEANARAQHVKAVVNLDLARERMGDVTIRAPIDGVIIQKSVEEGQIIQSASQNISGGTTILTMADLSEMQVRTLIDETDLGKISAGQQARVSVEAFPGRSFIGTVIKIEPQAVVEQNVTMFPVLVRLENRDGALKPGMNAEVVVEVARRQDVITVPNAAVVSTRDAMAAGTLLGLSEDQMRSAMRGARGALAQNDAPGNGGAPAAGAAPGAGAATGAASATAGGNAPGANPSAGGAPGRVSAGPPAGGNAPAANQGTRQAQAGPPAGGQRPGQGGRAARGIGNGDTRTGVLFVRTATGVEPRMAVLGLNDWDYTEVISGLEAGEEVVLMSVARLQQQQQEMLNRFRQNAGGVFPGAPAGGRR